MKNLASEYANQIQNLIVQLQEEECGNVLDAAGILKNAIADDRLIHVFGVSGHSVIGCEEFFWRAGGLANVNPLFDLSLNLSGGGVKSTKLERVPGVGDKVVGSSTAVAGDPMIITSIYGMNAATIDAALEAKRLGLRVIAITSRRHAAHTPADFVARHPSKQNLAEIADVTIDNHVPHGDCLINLPGLPQPVGASSTILVSFCVQWLVMETARLCLDAGLPVPVWRSANTVGGDEANAALLEEFVPRIKSL